MGKTGNSKLIFTIFNTVVLSYEERSSINHAQLKTEICDRIENRIVIVENVYCFILESLVCQSWVFRAVLCRRLWCSFAANRILRYRKTNNGFTYATLGTMRAANINHPE